MDSRLQPQFGRVPNKLIRHPVVTASEEDMRRFGILIDNLNGWRWVPLLLEESEANWIIVPASLVVVVTAQERPSSEATAPGRSELPLRTPDCAVAPTPGPLHL